MALEQVVFYDSKERSRNLSLNEVEAKKVARKEYIKEVLLEEISWRQKSW